MEHLVELDVDSLRVSVLRTLNDQRHEPSRHGRAGVPLESFRLVQVPKHAIAEHNEECDWASYRSAVTRYTPHDVLLLDFGRYPASAVHRPRALHRARGCPSTLFAWTTNRQPLICFGAANGLRQVKMKSRVELYRAKVEACRIQ